MTTELSNAQHSRIRSIDVLRGIIMVIMALDHVRDFFSAAPFNPVDVTQTTPAWFFTRWITHFCAPVFVLLAGMSAYLYGTKVNRADLRNFLLSRAVWLIFMEIAVINFLVSFDYNFIFLQVIWVIAVGFLVLAGLIYLSRWVMIVFVIVLLAGHNLLDGIQFDSYWWKMLHVQYFGSPVSIFYPIIPWPAILVLGYLFGELYTKSFEVRSKNLWITGGAFVLGFIILRSINVYGDAHAWEVSDRGAIYTFLDFLNVSKYPPSLLYVLITIGPALLVLPFLEKLSGKIESFFLVYGRVPFFYYAIHFFLIHVAAIVFNGVVYGEWRTWAFGGWPDGFKPSLLTAYVVWIVIIAMLYFPCKWFVGIKKTHTAWWLKYL